MQKKSNMSGLFPILVIIACLLVAEMIYYLVLGNPIHFVDAEKKTPKVGDIFGIMYKGGFLVPIILTMLMMVIVFTIERLLTLAKATGKGNISTFVRKVQYQLASNDLDGAERECDRQKGSVANVIKSGLKKYREMATN